MTSPCLPITQDYQKEESNDKGCYNQGRFPGCCVATCTQTKQEEHRSCEGQEETQPVDSKKLFVDSFGVSMILARRPMVEQESHDLTKSGPDKRNPNVPSPTSVLREIEGVDTEREERYNGPSEHGGIKASKLIGSNLVDGSQSIDL